MSAFLIDVEVPCHESAVRESLAKLELLKSQMRNSQLIVDIAEEEIRGNIQKLRDSLFLSRQSHEADLIWILGELKGTIAAWGDDEFHQAVTKDRVLNLVKALDEKTKGES